MKIYGGVDQILQKDEREKQYRNTFFGDYYDIDQDVSLKVGGKLRFDDDNTERLIALMLTDWDVLKNEIMGHGKNYYFRTPVINKVTNENEFVEGFVNYGRHSERPTVTFVGYKKDKRGLTETFVRQVV